MGRDRARDGVSTSDPHFRRTWKPELAYRFGTFFSHVPWLGVYIGLIPRIGNPLGKLLDHAQTLATLRLCQGSKRPDLFHYLVRATKAVSRKILK